MKSPAVLLWAGSALLYGSKCAGAFSFFTSARPPTSVGALVVLVSERLLWEPTFSIGYKPGRMGNQPSIAARLSLPCGLPGRLKAGYLRVTVARYISTTVLL